jgi:hypothetical protein
MNFTKKDWESTTTYLIHQHLCSSIKPCSNTVVERIFKALLLSHDYIQEVRFVDVWRLTQEAESGKTSVISKCTYQFLVKEYLYHALDRIPYVDELEELQQRRHTGSFFVFCWFI